MTKPSPERQQRKVERPRTPPKVLCGDWEEWATPCWCRNDHTNASVGDSPGRTLGTRPSLRKGCSSLGPTTVAAHNKRMMARPAKAANDPLLSHSAPRTGELGGQSVETHDKAASSRLQRPMWSGTSSRRHSENRLASEATRRSRPAVHLETAGWSRIDCSCNWNRKWVSDQVARFEVG